MNQKQKQTMVLLGLGGVAVLAFAASAKPAKAKAVEPSGPDEIDLDAIPDVSPGWPQPEPPAQKLPAETVVLPAPKLPVPIPTSLPQEVTLPAPSLPDELPPVPATIPIPSVVVPPRPPTSTAELPVVVPEDTATMTQRLLAQEAKPNWKTRDPVVKVWQESRGLTADGEFGTKTALRLADEIGVIPLIRFWPKGSYPEGSWVRDYQAELIRKAQAAPEPKRSQLMASADRERGQGFGRNPAAETKVVTLAADSPVSSVNLERPIA